MKHLDVNFGNFKLTPELYYSTVDFATLEFEEAILKISWIYNPQRIRTRQNNKFKVLICTKYENQKSDIDAKLCCFIKPIQVYDNPVFEQIFGFKKYSTNYNCEKTIALEYFDRYGINIYNS